MNGIVLCPSTPAQPIASGSHSFINEPPPFTVCYRVQGRREVLSGPHLWAASLSFAHTYGGRKTALLTVLCFCLLIKAIGPHALLCKAATSRPHKQKSNSLASSSRGARVTGMKMRTLCTKINPASSELLKQ